MKTCPDCGSRVYNLGCTWCNESAYIAEQESIDSRRSESMSPAMADTWERWADNIIDQIGDPQS